MGNRGADGAAVGGSKFPAAASKVAGAPMESCRFVSMDATAKSSFGYARRRNHPDFDAPVEKQIQVPPFSSLERGGGFSSPAKRGVAFPRQPRMISLGYMGVAFLRQPRMIFLG